MNAPREELLRALGRHIAAEQDAELAASEQLATRAATRAVATHTSAQAAVSASAGAAQRSSRRKQFVLGALAVAACAIAFWLHTRPLEVVVAGGGRVSVDEVVGAHDHTVALVFSDRTEIELAPDARVRLLALTPRGATLRLQAGRADVHVTPHREGEWTLHAGGFAVHVTGTRFVIDYQARDEVLAVRMLEGSVLVTGCTLGAARALSVGESFRASCTRGTEGMASATAPNERAPARAQQAAVTPPAAPPAADVGRAAQSAADTVHAAQRSSYAREADVVREHEKHHSRAALPKRRHRHHRHTAHKAATRPEQASTPQPTWQALARAGKFSAAYALGRDVELDTLSVSDALLLGDTARLSGDTTAALHIYQKVRQRHPGSDAAAAAAFASGQLQFDQRSAFKDAARWFALYLHERSTGPLAREASGRLLEALERSDQHGAAKRAAAAYLRAYPTGPHATFARGLLPAE